MVRTVSGDYICDVTTVCVVYCGVHGGVVKYVIVAHGLDCNEDGSGGWVDTWGAENNANAAVHARKRAR